MAATSFAFAFAFVSAQPVAEPVRFAGNDAEILSNEQSAASSATSPHRGEGDSDSDLLGLTQVAEPVHSTEPKSEPATPSDTPNSDDAFLDGIKEPSDPLEFFNRPSFAVSMALDKAIIRPAAMAYRAVIPAPARDGIRNGIANLNEPLVFVNDLLQLRPKRAVRTLGRFVINTVLGLGGVFDIAKRTPFHLPRRGNSFGSTLGYYGIGPGPFVYIPVLGPTTFRDGAAQFADSYASPRILGSIVHPDKHGPFLRNKLDLGKYGTAMTVVSGMDQREQNDAELKALLSDSVDPYATFRSSFLQNRAGDIAELKAKDGEAPATDGLDDPLTDPEAGE